MLLLESQYHNESSISSTLGEYASLPYHVVYTETVLDRVGYGNAWQKLQGFFFYVYGLPAYHQKAKKLTLDQLPRHSSHRFLLS